MLAIFQRSVGEGPHELIAAPERVRLSRSQSISGRLDTAELMQCFKHAHCGAVMLQFDEQHAMAYTHEHQHMLTPRQFASSGDIFCCFAGNLENIAQLRNMYGLDRHISEVNFVIEAYRTLRDRAPYPADQVVASLEGGFAFVLYDNQYKQVFVAADMDGRVPLYWGKCADDGVLAFSDDAAVLRKGTGPSFAPFPLGCYYSSARGLQSFAHPEKKLKAVPHVDSQGQLCGAAFKVDSCSDLTQVDS